MRTRVLAALAIASSIPVLAVAQSGFDGTWKIDLTKTSPPSEAEVLLLQSGIYHCKTCVPKIDVKTDGQDQSVAGSPYYDAISIKVLDDRSIEETDKKNGKTVRTSKLTVSPDGNTATQEFIDSTRSFPDPMTGKLVLTKPPKAKKPPAGSHAISGSWLISKMTDFSNNALVFTFKMEGDGLTMTNQTGQSFTAKLDGTEAPYKGDPGIDSVSLLRLGEHAFVETDKHGGKAVRSTRFMMLPGTPNTLDLMVSDATRDSSVLFVAAKQ